MIDKLGLIVQEDGDGGDCPCRTGVVIGYFGGINHEPSALNFIDAVQKNLVIGGKYIRYPLNPDYAIPSDFSRDQASRLFLGMAIAQKPDLVWGYYLSVFKNGLKHPNGDYIGTGEPGNIIRGLSKWWLWPALWLLDIKFLYDVLIGCRVQGWDYDNLFLMDLWLANFKWPTIWSKLAKKLYDKAAASLRIANNLADPKSGCREAFTANKWFLNNL